MKFRVIPILLCAVTSNLFAQCGDLFISEYIEGSSNNKALEIYNPTGASINLSGYSVVLKGFGSTGNPFTNPPFNFPNINLAPNSVYVIAHASASPTILAIADTTNTNCTNFNGDDAVILFHGTDTIDIIGVVGQDPGTNWTLPLGGATSEFTLVRKSNVISGTTNWAISENQWDSYPQNTFTYLGSHTADPITDTIVRFSPTSGTYDEGQNFNLTATLSNPSPSTVFMVDVVLKTGNAADINNYTTQTLTFPTNSTSAFIPVTITDDALPEGAEVLTFALRNASPGLVLCGDTIFTLTISPSDQPAGNLLPIGVVRGGNANGVPDSLNVDCRIGGVVYGANLRTSGLQFFINDHTGGIGVFAPVATFGYTVNEGDSLIIEGTVAHFNGLGQMAFLDTVIFVSAGNAIQAPQIVTNLDESTESELIRINNCSLVNASQWTNAAAGFNVDITDGTNTYVLRIAQNTTATSVPVPTSAFHVIGMGSQFDSSSPYTSGYQIQPRWAEDIIPAVGIDETESIELTVFPNPTSGLLMIRCAAEASAVVNVFDLSGRIIYSHNCNIIADQNSVLDLSHFSNGIYSVEVISDDLRVTRKVVVNK